MKNKLNIWSLSWPLFIELFLRTFLGVVNTYMLSFFSDDSVAAIGVSDQIIRMLMILYNVVGFGTGILVSQHLGAGNKGKARDVSVVAFYMNFAFSLVAGIAFTFAARPLLGLMQIPENLMNDAVAYMRIVGLFSFSQSLLATMSATIKSHGYTHISMIVAIGMNMLNIVGAYIALFQPFGLPFYGVRGVAVSTSISQFIAVIAMLYVMRVKLGELPDIRRLNKSLKWVVGDLLKIGIPSAGEHFSYTFSQLMITSFVATMGAQALAINVYALTLTNFIRIIAYAIGSGTQILIGHLTGAGDYDGAYTTCGKSLKVGVSANVCMAIVMTVFRRPLFGLFTDNKEMIAIGIILVSMTLLLDSGRAFNSIYINALRGAGDVRYPVIVGVLSMWGVSVTMAYFLGVHLKLGLPGVWLAFTMDEWLRGLLMMSRWRSGKWEKMSFITELSS